MFEQFILKEMSLMLIVTNWSSNLFIFVHISLLLGLLHVKSGQDRFSMKLMMQIYLPLGLDSIFSFSWFVKQYQILFMPREFVGSIEHKYSSFISILSCAFCMCSTSDINCLAQPHISFMELICHFTKQNQALDKNF